MNGAHDGGRSPFIQRIGWAELLSCPSSTANISLAESGSILVRTDEALHVVHIADGLASTQPTDTSVRHYTSLTKETRLFQTTIPISATLAKAKFDSQTSSSRADLMHYDSRFMGAKWCPLEIGPYLSPLFASLTTKRTLHVFQSRVNHLKGPYTVLTCVNNDVDDEAFRTPLSSFAWLQPTAEEETLRCAYLIGTSLNGALLVWRLNSTLNGIQVSESANHSIGIGVAHQIACSSPDLLAGDRYLAIASSQEGVQVIKVTSQQDGLSFEPVEADCPTERGVRITWMQWMENRLLFCAAGSVHCVDVLGKQNWSALLGCTEGEEEAFYLQPPAGLRQNEDESLELVLQDGNVYRLPLLRAKTRAAGTVLTPTSTIQAPLELIADEKRKVERLQGLYAYVEDGCGMSFLCYDVNEIAAWSYLLNPRCSLEPAFTQVIQPDEHLNRASQTLDRILHGNERGSKQQTRLRRYLSFLYSDCQDKKELVEICIEALNRCQTDPSSSERSIQAALMLASWLRTIADLTVEMAQEVENLCKDLQALSAQASLTSNLYEPALETKPPGGAEGASIERQLLVLAASALVASGYATPPLNESSCQRLAINAKGKAYGIKLVKEWVRLFKDGKELDLGESCAACEAPVTMNATSLLTARCKNGHPWRRCSTTRALLTSISALECILCGAQAMLRIDSANDLQRTMLDRAEHCTLCNGAFIQV